MKKILILLMLVSVPAYGAEYVVEKSNGSVVIVTYNEGSRDSLGGVIDELGLTGLPIERLEKADVPQDKTDRKYWRMNKVPIGAKIKIDAQAKEADQAAHQAKEARKRALFKMTPAEYQEAKDLEIVK